MPKSRKLFEALRANVGEFPRVVASRVVLVLPESAGVEPGTYEIKVEIQPKPLEPYDWSKVICKCGIPVFHPESEDKICECGHSCQDHDFSAHNLGCQAEGCNSEKCTEMFARRTD